MHVLHVVGARPNFMKVAPVMAAFAERPHIRQTLVHTGQHYDANMSQIFFDQLGIPRPDISLGVGSGSHAVQTANIMVEFERALLERSPDLVVVYGDINSTMAAALVASKLHVPVAHVEAGLRSGDRHMPEELNRLVTDQLADVLLTPSRDGDEHLLAEGIPAERIHFVGNVMIDTLVRLLPKARLPDISGMSDRFALVTLHRPSNVDSREMLQKLLAALDTISHDCQIVFPVHPRTRNRMKEVGFVEENHPNILLTDPLGYLEFLALQKHSAVVITDSGGIQEETTYLGVPCLTMRENTERPITIDVGTNKLIGTDTNLLMSEVATILNGDISKGCIPELWDGQAGQRVADVLEGVAGTLLKASPAAA